MAAIGCFTVLCDCGDFIDIPVSVTDIDVETCKMTLDWPPTRDAVVAIAIAHAELTGCLMRIGEGEALVRRTG
jgi:hypothetical protein